MKKAEVEIGAVYYVKVSEKIAKVHVYAKCNYGGWWGTNLATNRDIRIRTAARLRGKVQLPRPLVEPNPVVAATVQAEPDWWKGYVITEIFAGYSVHAYEVLQMCGDGVTVWAKCGTFPTVEAARANVDEETRSVATECSICRRVHGREIIHECE